MSWQPAQYERFKEERAQPFRDLVALIRPEPGLRVLDLGCGTGALTRELHESLGARETLGIDSSAEMLEGSKALETPTLHFQRSDIETFGADQPFDLVFSNAALHWLPDHPDLFLRLRTLLAPGGQLAVQMPSNETHLSHGTAVEVAASCLRKLTPSCCMTSGSVSSTWSCAFTDTSWKAEPTSSSGSRAPC